MDRFFTPKNNINLEQNTCIIEGDSKYYSIAAASILAKVSRDAEIERLCDQYPELEQYGLRSNVGYGSLQHRSAIEKLGITNLHRKSFGICKQYLNQVTTII